MKLCMFKMLTPKRENKKRFPTRLWIPDIDPNFWCAARVLHTHDNGEEVVLNWSNFDISTFFFPQKVCALSSGYFKPFRIFLLPGFTVTVSAMYTITQKLFIAYIQPINTNHFANNMYFN